MGLYATVKGEEIKYGGLFAKAAAASGIVEKNAAVQITRNEVRDILVGVHRGLYSGLDLGVEYGTPLSFERLAIDAHRLALLWEWVIDSDCDTLTFT